MTTRNRKGPGSPGPDEVDASDGDLVTDPAEMADLLNDSYTRQLVKEARSGDPLAQKRLHEALAEDLQAGWLTEYQRNVLIAMHARISGGDNLQDATLTAAPHSRPPQIRRDKEMFLAVFKRLHEPRNGAPLPSGAVRKIYEDVGREFGVSWRTVKGVYLRERKAP